MSLPTRLPSKPTLDRYGLTLAEWLAYIPDDRCPVCGNHPPSGRFVTDHEHVKGWKDMPKAERRKYVRGVVCTVCNHFILTRYGTPAKHRGAADYLEAYERRKREQHGA